VIRALLVAISGILAICGNAQTVLTVSGRVVDENDGAVPLASIRFQSAEGPDSQVQASTGPAGDFTVQLPASGTFRVTITHTGFFPLKEAAFETGAGSQAVRFILNHVTELTSAIKVEAEQDGVDLQQTESRQSLSNLDIINIPYQGRDVSRALKLMPGVTEDRNGGLHLSGSAVNQVLYTMDGFNVTDPLTGDFTARVNVDAVRSIDYASGRYSPEFGKGSAGTVTIATQMGTDVLRYNFTNVVPGVDTGNGLHIGTWSPRFELSGPIVKKRIWFFESAEAAYSQLVIADVKDRNRSSSLRYDNLWRTQVNLTPTNQLFVSLLVNSSRAAGTGLSALDPYSTTVDRRSRMWFASFKHSKYFHGGAVLEWGYAEDRTVGRQIPQGSELYIMSPAGRSGNFFVDSREESSRKQVIVNFWPRAWRLAGTHQLKVGLDLDRLNYSAHNVRTGYEQWGLTGHLLNRITFAGSGTFSRPNVEAASYVVDSWKVKPSLTIEAGIRQDWDELLRNMAFSPRVSVAWSPFHWKNTKLSGGYAVTRDSTQLPLFARPLDQSSVTVNYGPDGQVTFGPALTYFLIRDRNFRTPKYANWTAEVEHRLPRSAVLTVKYARKRGVDGLTYVAIPSPYDPALNGRFDLENFRRDVFDSAEVAVRQTFGKEYAWMASYTRSRALSNSVVSLSVDEPLWVVNNVGPMPWDSPNHLLAWGHFPTPLKGWSFATLVEARTGFPFSLATDYGSTVGAVNSQRYPAYFDLDLHLERRLRLGKRMVALRGGFSNITNHQNPTVVNNIVGAPRFMSFYGSQGRHVVFRLRWLGTGE
jgi:hypothetical protein